MWSFTEPYLDYGSLKIGRRIQDEIYAFFCTIVALGCSFKPRCKPKLKSAYPSVQSVLDRKYQDVICA